MLRVIYQQLIRDLAAPWGSRRPCSQLRSVATLTPMKVAKADGLKPNLLRILATSPALGIFNLGDSEFKLSFCHSLISLISCEISAPWGWFHRGDNLFWPKTVTDYMHLIKPAGVLHKIRRSYEYLRFINKIPTHIMPLLPLSIAQLWLVKLKS